MRTAYTFLNGINISAEIAVFNSMGVLPCLYGVNEFTHRVGREKYKIK